MNISVEQKDENSISIRVSETRHDFDLIVKLETAKNIADKINEILREQ